MIGPAGNRVTGEALARALRLYVLTDRGLAGDTSDVDVVRSAIAGGATAVQLRWKTGPRDDALNVGREIAALCREQGVLFVVNDHFDLALALGADGLHLGDQDMPLSDARRAAESRLIVGYSPPTLVEAIQAERLGADYLGIGPIYGTTTKQDAGVAVGLKRIREVVEAVSIPVVGIGGITPENAAPVIAAGAAGVAVISAVVAAPDVEAAARALRTAVDRELLLRG
jgi:thiamine-phosphate diphosphorylase